jgi:hypothetical protein
MRSSLIPCERIRFRAWRVIRIGFTAEVYRKSTFVPLAKESAAQEISRVESAGYLTKPISQAELREAILAALGAPPPGTPPPLVTRHALREVREARDLTGTSDRNGRVPVTEEPWPRRSAS